MISLHLTRSQRSIRSFYVTVFQCCAFHRKRNWLPEHLSFFVDRNWQKGQRDVFLIKRACCIIYHDFCNHCCLNDVEDESHLVLFITRIAKFFRNWQEFFFPFWSDCWKYCFTALHECWEERETSFFVSFIEYDVCIHFTQKPT